MKTLININSPAEQNWVEEENIIQGVQEMGVPKQSLIAVKGLFWYTNFWDTLYEFSGIIYNLICIIFHHLDLSLEGLIEEIEELCQYLALWTNL